MSKQQFSTPIIFCVFNRPDTTARVFAEIAKVRPERLLIVADGPRPDRPGEAEKCEAVRAIVRNIDWPCQVEENFATENMGCGKRISSGLTWAFERVSEAIILEDDCVPHADFFPFCAQLLERYADDERIMMISGTNPLVQLDIPESYYFSRYFSIWGWATWRRAWQLYDFTMSRWPQLKAENQLRYYYPQAYMRRHISNLLDMLCQGRIDTWDVSWLYTCLFNNGLAVVPRVNLVSNIGVVGTHADETMDSPTLPVFPLDSENLIHPALITPDIESDERYFKKYFTPWHHIKTRIKGRWRKIVNSIR